MQWNAQQHATKPAIVFESETLNWDELWQKVQAATADLSAHLSSQEQEVAAILLPNSIEFVVAYLAVVHAGHIALPLDTAYKQLELDAIIDQVPSKLIITNKNYRSQISNHHEPVILASSLMSAKPPAKPSKYLRLPAEGQIASLTFTSGTTGKPKAVPNTHLNHIWNIKVCSMVWDWTEADTLLVSVPLSHMLGVIMGLAGVIYHGNTMYLQRWFSEKDTLEALASGKITFFYARRAGLRKTDSTEG